MFELLQLLHNHDDSGRLLMMMSTANSAESYYSPLATFGFGSVLGIPLFFEISSETFEARFNAYSTLYVTLNLFSGWQ